ncbi:DUF3413 domain-containing protein [Volucribacter amazonae]|uniref:Inner membrane protein YejM n=1 Tax=Volucribacter amazonae TaxID=256731 RepID=A0A9X4PE05_9PAST|nr:DUF3413 domain-containing protein [Volucribacter amazonae]MDG6895929.1 hypothetical protein [Volucribacter amazonae]
MIKVSRQYKEDTSQKISWGHWFAFFNIIWAIIIGSRYAFLIDWPDTLFGRVYFFISILGHFSFVVFAFYLLIIFPLSFIVKNHRTFRGLSVIIATLCISILLIDTQVFAEFNFHLSSVVWNLLVNPENGELARSWQIFFAFMPLILLTEMVFSRWSWYKLRSLNRQKWRTWIAPLFFGCFIATHLIYTWADAVFYRPITMQKSNFPLSYPMTARSFLQKHGFLDKQEYSQTIQQQGRLDAAKLDYPKQPLIVDPAHQAQNILFITIAGLRYDAIDPTTMPALNQFASQASEFTNHYSTGNNANTALAGLFYGLNANYVDSLLNAHLGSLLLQLAQQQHYQIGLFSDNNFNQFLFRQGILQQITVHNQANQTDIEAIQALQQWYHNALTQQQPLFAYLDLNIANNLEPTAYYAELNKLDQALAPLLSQIGSNTLVVITAEYGYSFNNNAKQDNFSRQQIQVPLIIYGDHLPVGKINKLTSHVDLLATLLPLYGVQNPANTYSQGENLFTPERQFNWVIAGNYRWKVIITPNGTQYHIDNKGNYQKYNADYQAESSATPPLGLFLEVFRQNHQFFAD